METNLKTNMQVPLLPATLNCHKSPLRMKLYQAVRISLQAEIYREDTTMLCYTYISCVVQILYWLKKLYLITVY